MGQKKGLIHNLASLLDCRNQFAEVLIRAGERDWQTIATRNKIRLTNKLFLDRQDILPANDFDAITSDLPGYMKQTLFADDNTFTPGSLDLNAINHASFEKGI